MHFDSFLKSRLDLALSVSTMRFWRCHSLQLKFSSRWPCSRKLATLVQTYENFSRGYEGGRVGVEWVRTFHVFVRVSASLRLLNGTKDLFPWGGRAER